MDYLGLVANIIGIVGFVCTCLWSIQTWKLKKYLEQNAKRLDSVVSLVLQNETDPEDRIVHPAKTMRRAFGRNEIQGLLANIQREKTKRYAIKFTEKAQYYEQINELLLGNQTEFVIPCEPEELNQFVRLAPQ